MELESASPLEECFRLVPPQKRALDKLRLKTAADLLFYFPQRYAPKLPLKKIAELKPGDQAAVVGRVIQSQTRKAWRKKIPLGEISLTDGTGKIKAVWFHQPYLAKKAAVGRLIRMVGKIAARRGELYFPNPEIELVEKWTDPDSLFRQTEETGNDHLQPVYPVSYGISSNWLHHKVKKILETGLHLKIPDPVPKSILQKYHLPPLSTALIWIHLPQREKDAAVARKRFAFEEVFLIQLARLHNKQQYQSHQSFIIDPETETLAAFVQSLPFRLTDAQERSVKTILQDLKNQRPMVRLLQGDVGSGKTAVAAITAFAAVAGGFEVAYMVPTEVLARQHFESFSQYFRRWNIPIGLILGSGCFKFPSKINPSSAARVARSQLLKWTAEGKISILIGTHTLISTRGRRAVKFKNLAYVIIDEQHRFGVMQRAELTRKEGRVPHLLSMTATPIPRTLALTIYGDLDLTLLDEMPAGRRPIITKILAESERQEAYRAIREEIARGRQAYVICPRIDPQKSLTRETKSAKAEQERLQKEIFPAAVVGLIHGQLKPREREGTRVAFAAGQIDVLVATSVVEVGINVPKATAILIEGAERFGLAQLHQLRGRVLRSNDQAYCYLSTETKNPKSRARLKALLRAKNGFELAELDLKLRGPGELSGTNQWGISDLGMEALKNLKMVEAAREEAQQLLRDDPDLLQLPRLKTKLAARERTSHPE